MLLYKDFKGNEMRKKLRVVVISSVCLNMVMFVIFLMGAGVPSNPLGQLVFDSSNQSNNLEMVAKMADELKNEEEMLKNVGKGDFTPTTVSWMQDKKNQCGFEGRFSFGWFKFPKIPQLCGNEDEAMETFVEDVVQNFLPNTNDTSDEREEKQVNRESELLSTKSYLIGKSHVVLQGNEGKKDNLGNMQAGLNGSADQIEVAKIQTEILIQILAEQQDINENLALVMKHVALEN